jgi:hypothetical protein
MRLGFLTTIPGMLLIVASSAAAQAETCEALFAAKGFPSKAVASETHIFIGWNGAKSIKCRNAGLSLICGSRQFSPDGSFAYDKNGESWLIDWNNPVATSNCLRQVSGYYLSLTDEKYTGIIRSSGTKVTRTLRRLQQYKATVPVF